MPRIALISDIHANLEAFDAVLRDIAGCAVDQVVCLGDIVGYGPDPVRCVELAFTVCDKIILGNHDEAVVNEAMSRRFNQRAQVSIQITRQLLPDEHVNLLATLPDMAKVEDLTAAHASFGPHQYEYLYCTESASRSFFGLRTRIGAVGHTHVPSMFTSLEGAHDILNQIEILPLAGNVAMPLPDDRQTIINPGSVGQPRDRNPDASWGLLDTESNTFQIKRVAYDIDTVGDKIARLGLPDFLGERLRVGA